MLQQRRRESVRDARIGGIVALLIGILTACAGPGGDGLSTIGAVGTAGSTRAASTGSAAASTGTTASNTVAAAVGSAAASPNAAGSAAASTPAVAGSAASMSSRPAGAGSAPAGSITVGSATSARPATSNSPAAGAASAVARTATTGAVTTGSATAGGQGNAPRATTAGTITATTSASAAMIPPPPGAVEYVPGTNTIIDTILQGAQQGLNSSSDTVTVTSSKNYTTPSSASDVVTFYQMQMPKLGWTSEQNQEASSGITTLVYSRDNKTNAALLLVVDLTQIGQKGCLVITALAKPK